ncbi:cupin domain-containing protein [uncultured Sphingomonas sp.]|uniref:cupin domain-containing protein n=1 Tax=uncultured Sphingomonas sp. TaxID=158754 RepID=UPI0035CBF2BD
MGDPGEQATSDAATRHEPTEPSGSEDRAAGPGGGADPKHKHLFHLTGMAASRYDGGELRGAAADNWKVLSGQQGSVYIARLKPGGVREPHWHPSGWEMNFVVSGHVRWSIVGPGGTSDAFEGECGDLVFAPQGHFHYFENASASEDLVVLIVFNTSAGEPDDDVGLVESLSAIPADALAAVFGAPTEVFANLPRKTDRVVIARKQGHAS